MVRRKKKNSRRGFGIFGRGRTMWGRLAVFRLGAGEGKARKKARIEGGKFGTSRGRKRGWPNDLFELISNKAVRGGMKKALTAFRKGGGLRKRWR